MLLCDNVFASPLPIKQNDSKLRSTRSEENLAHPIANVFPLNPTLNYLNCETQSLDAELIDSYRSTVNSDDDDIWSTSDDVNLDDQQNLHPNSSSTSSSSRRNGLIGYRTHHLTIDTQSIRSTESHLSQQEIMPSDIRKRLSEVQNTGPILFDVKKKVFFFDFDRLFLFSEIPKIRQPLR